MANRLLAPNAVPAIRTSSSVHHRRIPTAVRCQLHRVARHRMRPPAVQAVADCRSTPRGVISLRSAVLPFTTPTVRCTVRRLRVGGLGVVALVQHTAHRSLKRKRRMIPGRCQQAPSLALQAQTVGTIRTSPLCRSELFIICRILR